LWTAFRRNWNGCTAEGAILCIRWSGSRLFFESVYLLDDHEDNKGNNREIKDCVNEQPVADNRGFCIFCGLEIGEQGNFTTLCSGKVEFSP
jgi:hypothetical protein